MKLDFEIVREKISLLVVLIALVLLTTISGVVQAEEDLFHVKNQAGIRLGVWLNRGDLPPATSTYDQSTLVSHITSGSFHFEGFLAYRFSSRLAGELSVGVINRGEVAWQIDPDNSGPTYFGNLYIYPILAKMKIYPLSKGIGKFNPYIMGGGGIYYARDALFAAGEGSYSSRYIPEEPSATSINYVVGAGFDWPLASVVGVDFQAQYMPINYSDRLLDVSKWSGLSITFGVKYLFMAKKKEER